MGTLPRSVVRWIAIGVAAAAAVTSSQWANLSPSYASPPSGKIYELGFPSRAGGSSDAVAAGSFKAVEVYPNIVVANREMPFRNNRYAEFQSWDAPYSDEKWSSYVDRIRSMIDSIASTSTGRATLDAAGSAKSTVIDGNRWVTWDSAAPSATAKLVGDSPVGVVIFPHDSGQTSEHTLSDAHSRDGHGTASAVQLAVEDYEQSFLRDGRAMVQDIRVDLQHELFHAAQAAVGATPPNREVRVFAESFNVRPDGTIATQSYLMPVNESEPWTQGGDTGTAAVRQTWENRLRIDAMVTDFTSHMSADDLAALSADIAGERALSRMSPERLRAISTSTLTALSERAFLTLRLAVASFPSATESAAAEARISALPKQQNPYLMKSYTDVLRTGPTDAEGVRQLRLRLELAAQNPTSVRFAAELGTVARPEYVAPIRENADGTETYTTKVRQVGEGFPTKAELLDPYGSGRFVQRSGSAPVPVCGGAGAPNLCQPRERVALSEDEVKEWNERVDAYKKSVSGRSSEVDFLLSLSPEERVSTARVLTDSLLDRVRDVGVQAPAVRQQQLDSLFKQAGRVAEVPMPLTGSTAEQIKRNLRGLVGGTEPEDGAGTVANVAMFAQAIASAFVTDSSGLTKAAALTSVVPVIGPLLWLADASDRNDPVGISAASLAVVSQGIEAALATGLIASEAAAAWLSVIAEATGGLSLVLVGGAMLWSLIDAIRAENELLNPTPQPGDAVTVPTLQTGGGEWGSKSYRIWTSEYAKARLENGFNDWGHKVMIGVLPDLLKAVKPGFEDTVKLVHWSTLVAEEAARQQSAAAGDSAADTQAAIDKIRAEGAKLLEAAHGGAETAAFDTYNKVAESVNSGALQNQYREWFWLNTLLPAWKADKTDYCNHLTAGVENLKYETCTALVEEFTVADLRGGATKSKSYSSTLKGSGTVTISTPALDPVQTSYSRPVKPVVTSSYRQILDETIEGKNHLAGQQKFFEPTPIPAVSSMVRDLPVGFTTPAPVVNGVAPASHNELIRLINGTGPAGGSFTVTDQNNNQICAGTVSGYGVWGCRPNNPVRPDGSVTALNVRVTKDGTTKTASQPLRAQQLAIVHPTTGQVVDPNNAGEWSGLAPADHDLTGTVSCSRGRDRPQEFPLTTTRDGNTWTVHPRASNMLPNTSCTLSIADKTTFGLQQVEFTTTTPGPVALKVTNPASDDTTVSPGFTIAGVGGVPGRTVTIYVDIEREPLCTATITDDRTWSCTILRPLGPGRHWLDVNTPPEQTGVINYARFSVIGE